MGFIYGPFDKCCRMVEKHQTPRIPPSSGWGNPFHQLITMVQQHIGMYYLAFWAEHEVINDLLQRAGQQVIVRVYQTDDRAMRHRNSFIKGIGDPVIRFTDECIYLIAECPHNFLRTIRRAAINNDIFDVRCFLLQNASDRSFDGVSAVEANRHNRE